MNWKRGLTRVYILLWMIYAVVCLRLPMDMLSDRRNNEEIVARFLQEHPQITLKQLQTQEASRIMQAQAPPDDDNYLVSSGVLLAQTIAHRDDYRHPWKALPLIWGMWVLIALVPPAIIFGILKWISKGFVKN